MYDTFARTQLLQAHMTERLREASEARAANAYDVPRRQLMRSLLARIRKPARTLGHVRAVTGLVQHP